MFGRRQGSVIYHVPWQHKWARCVSVLMVPLALLLLLALFGRLFGDQGLERVFRLKAIVFENDPIFVEREALIKDIQQQLQEENLLNIDIYALRRYLESIAWVQDVEIRKQWPNRLYVRLYEREPFARLGDEELIDVYGVRFKPARMGMYHDLVRLDAPQGFEADVLDVYKKMHDWALAHDIGLAGISLDNNLHWHLQLNSGIHVLLGNQDLNLRIARLSYLNSNYELNPQWVESINMNYHGACAVKIRSGAQKTTPKEQQQQQLFI